MSRIAVLLLSFAVASCGLGDAARAQADRYKEICTDRPAMSGDTLYYCGALDDAFLAFVEDNTSPAISTLIVTSYGGQFHATRDALAILERNGVKIVAEGVCASACAQYLFLPASKGELLPDTILALHETSTSLRAMRLRQDWDHHDRLRPLMDTAAQEEEAFYRQYGLDPHLLVEPMLAMSPVCISEKVDWTHPQWPRMDYFARYLWWEPRRAELERLGMKPKEGAWIETLGDIQALSKSIKKYGMGNTVIGGNPDFRMKAEKLGQLPKCETLEKDQLQSR